MCCKRSRYISIDVNRKSWTALAEVTGAKNIYERSDVDARRREGLSESVGPLRGGPLPEFVEIDEGARFLVDIERGHKTGFYLDQRENRRLMGDLVNHLLEQVQKPPNQNVEPPSVTAADSQSPPDNMTSCTRSTSMHRVQRLSWRNAISRSTIPNGKRRMRPLNSFLADSFDYLRHCEREGESFDLVVLDPPKFAPHKSQIQRAARGYKDLNLNAFKLVRQGGYLMTFSCSGAISRDLFPEDCLWRVGGFGVGKRRLSSNFRPAADHPVALTFP